MTTQEKSNAIFDFIERQYWTLFSPASITYYNSGTYYRNYFNNAWLAVYQNDLYFSVGGQVTCYGTLDEANKYLCNNRCFTVDTVNRSICLSALINNLAAASVFASGIDCSPYLTPSQLERLMSNGRQQLNTIGNIRN